MKNIYVIAGLLFLASCGQVEVEQAAVADIPATPETVIEQIVEEDSVDDETTPESDPVEPETQAKPEEAIVEPVVEEEPEVEIPSEEINDEVAALETAEEDVSKTITLDASYTNPKGLIDMVVNYSLDSEGLISSIEVTTLSATEKRIPALNESAQEFIGSPLSAALDFKYKAGSSLSGGAFISAIKSAL